MAVVGAISQQIWDMKYRLRAPANGEVPGEPLDKTIEDTWRRVATALAAPEREPATWAERFYRAMEDFKFLPAGRVVAGAGIEPHGHLVQLLCDGDDPRRHGRDLRPSARGGADHAAGRRHRLRFLDAPARAARRSKASGADASGPLSFMDVWDAMCRTIMSAGYRRGAMMATLRLRPSRHRGLHRGQARARPAAHVQPVGAGHRRLHDGGRRKTRRGNCRSPAPSPRCCRRASCGTRSCGRPMPMPSPA